MVMVWGNTLIHNETHSNAAVGPVSVELERAQASSSGYVGTTGSLPGENEIASGDGGIITIHLDIVNIEILYTGRVLVAGIALLIRLLSDGALKGNGDRPTPIGSFR